MAEGGVGNPHSQKKRGRFDGLHTHRACLPGIEWQTVDAVGIVLRLIGQRLAIRAEVNDPEAIRRTDDNGAR